MKNVLQRTRHGWVGLCIVMAAAQVLADDWPQWRGVQRDGVWQESGIVTRLPKPQVPIRWRAPIGSGYSGPTVADGRVFVTDRLIKPAQVERIHAFDEITGKMLWSHSYPCPYKDVSYDAGPRASVLVDAERGYALGTMGHLHCFDVATGKIHWQKDLVTEFNVDMPVWGIAASPIVERDLLICQIGGRPGACLVAFDKRSGALQWKSLDDPASYSAPIVVNQAGRRVLVCLTGANVVGVAPESGQLLWFHPFPPRRMVIGVASPVYHQGQILVTSFFDGALLLRLDPNRLAVDKVWHRVGASERDTDGIQSIITTPLIVDQHVYGVDSYGELRCLSLATGDRVWTNETAVPRARWATIHLVPNGDQVWMFNERGELLITRLSPRGFTEISRSKLLEPTLDQLRQRGGVCWSHPAFANRCVFARNDQELICASLAGGSTR